MNKYEITNIKKQYKGIELFRIRALKDFGNVEKGDLGGWIQKEENLSQLGNCWIFAEAMVYQNAKVSENAEVFDFAKVSGFAKISGHSKVLKYSEVN